MRAFFLSISIFFLMAAPALAGQKYAVIFGTNYKGDSPISDLDLCEKDAEKMKSEILKTGNFKKENLRVFLGSMVTRKNMEDNIKGWLGSRVKKGDQVFIYFSGHGTTRRDPNAKNGMRNYLVMYNRPHVTDDELNSWLKKVKTEKTVFIIDCCFSGGIAKKGAATRGNGNIPIPEGQNSVVIQNAEDVYFQNKVVIAASDANETAIELGGSINHGVFTYYFSEAMNKADLNNDKNVTALEAFFSSKKKIMKTAKRVNHKQTPQISGNASGFYFRGGPAVTPTPAKPEPNNNPVAPVTPVVVNPAPVAPVVPPNVKPPSPAKPPVTNDEPVNPSNKARGALLLKTTITKKYGKNIEVYVGKKKMRSSLQWKKDPDWKYIANIRVKNIPTGVHNVTIKSQSYPDTVLKTAIEKNDITVESIAMSRKGKASLIGNVWNGNFESPVSKVKVFIKPPPNFKQPHVTTDKNGQFKITEMRPGKYKLMVVGKLGLYTKTEYKDIRVEKDEVSTADIVLREFYSKKKKKR